MKKNGERAEDAESISRKAENALRHLKITVITCSVLAVLLPAVSIILFLTCEKAIYGLVALIVSMCAFVAMLAVLAGVFVYVRKQIRTLNSLCDPDTEEEGEKADEENT